ncbi:N-acetylmuramoyl-L-alanine amidase family protein [Bacillus thermotolerans]|uniref:N-acetylmuramoyl-L-alanine amidase n=1 Tax=Bacillus thermotolerans TaxID=1221996 RepID=A0A0F5HMT1_BACTR|nr:N-acetylmuramoyl-L-alanine amidase [Bacillus thermotolerans]KKB34147.1 N-acetylmuramoyl-L-alanine amidase [Bacillus thermotolerans]KKB34601.1 N-acetylmuramoyl-L-alanine amidase [Bacillus thermotolerans]
MLFVLDAGHGGKDPGAVANGLQEKDITLQLALKTGAYLRKHYNCEVMYTRNKDVYLGLSERAAMANRAKADFFCSFHINSFNAQSKGFETFRFPGTKGKTASLQQCVHEEVMKVMKGHGITDRGIKEKNLAVVRETSMPAILTETLFISNPDEANLLKSEGFIEKVAHAYAIGLAKAARLTKKTDEETGKEYYLATGRFKNKAQAEESAKMLRETYGWTIYVKET